MPVPTDRARHHGWAAPAGVETFGVDPVPGALRTSTRYQLFVIVANILVNPGTMLVGGLAVVSGLSFAEAVVSTTVGMVVAFAACIAMATPGADHGVPGQVAARAIFGLRGAKWLPSPLRAIASIYWFAFQTMAGAMAIVAVLDSWFGGRHSLVAVSLGFALLQVVVALIGFRSLKVLARVTFPVKLVIVGYLFFLMIRHDAPGYAPAEALAWPGRPGPHWLLFATWLNAAAAAWLTMVGDGADLCRYARSRAAKWIGTIGGVTAGALFSTLLGAYGAAATLGRSANPFEVVAGIGATSLTLLLILVAIALDNWTVNVLNLYTGGLALTNSVERLGRFWATLAVSIFGVALSAMPDLVKEFVGSMSALGNICAPIAGVLLADYLVIKRGRIDVPALFERGGRYWFQHGFATLALVWVALGALLYGLVIPTAWIPSLVTLVVTGLGYWLTAAPFAGRRTPG